jgi:hypothetical protein
MTRMQIIAKTSLAALGIYAVTIMYHWYPARYVSSVLTEVLCLSAVTVLAAVIVYFLVFNNNSLARKMAPAAEQLGPENQAAWLIKSLRVGLVFAGLMLLPTSIPSMLAILKLPFLVRPLINEALAARGIPDSLRLSYWVWYYNLYQFLRVTLSVYLICGAPHFVRWQVRRLRQESKLQPARPPAPPIANIERTRDE